jgi:Serine hydrolase (FSH1)
MLPVFASCAPFHRWVTRKWKLGEGDVEETSREEVGLVDGVLDECVAREGGWERVVGVLGFSQGARLVPGLLVRQKLLEKAGKESKWKFKFGVMVGGPYPPISMSEDVDVNNYELLRELPTVHAWGRDDHVKSGCVEMQRACESDVCFQMDFEGGHHMPLTDVEAKDLCDLIMAAWYAGGGSYEVGRGEKY